MKLGDATKKWNATGKPGEIIKKKISNDKTLMEYGVYGFELVHSSNEGVSISNRVVLFTLYPGKWWSNKFEGLMPGSESYNSAWKKCAEKPELFAQDQWEFVKDGIYGQTAGKLKEYYGLDLEKFDPVIKEMVWSFALDSDPVRALVIMGRAFNVKKEDLTVKKIIENGYEAYKKMGQNIVGSHWDKRMGEEKAILLDLIGKNMEGYT